MNNREAFESLEQNKGKFLPRTETGYRDTFIDRDYKMFCLGFRAFAEANVCSRSHPHDDMSETCEWLSVEAKKTCLASQAQQELGDQKLGGEFVQPHWGHVGQAFIDGAREAKMNPDADDELFMRAADGYTKRLFEELDPISESLLRTNAYEPSMSMSQFANKADYEAAIQSQAQKESENVKDWLASRARGKFGLPPPAEGVTK